MSGREGHDAMALQRQHVLQLLGTVTGALHAAPAAQHSHADQSCLHAGDAMETGGDATVRGGNRDTNTGDATLRGGNRGTNTGDATSTSNKSSANTGDSSTTIVKMEGKRDMECQGAQWLTRESSKRRCSSESENSDCEESRSVRKESRAVDVNIANTLKAEGQNIRRKKAREISESSASDDSESAASDSETEEGERNRPVEQHAAADTELSTNGNDSHLNNFPQCKKENKNKNPRASEGIEELLKRAKEFSSQRVPITGSMFATATHANTEDSYTSDDKITDDQVLKDRRSINSSQKAVVSIAPTPNKRSRLSSTKSNTSAHSEFISSKSDSVTVSKASASPVANSVTGSKCRDDIVQDSSSFNLSDPLLVMDYHEHFNGDNNFTKGCKWSPDGGVLLTLSADQRFRLWRLPAPLAATTFSGSKGSLEQCPDARHPALTVPEGELVYDYQWYPLMAQDDPTSQTFVCCCRGLPVHMWDANSGELVCSYRPFNHLDELAPTSSLGFSRDGCQLVCGFNKCIRMFNTNRPGRQCTSICGKRQNGIISCFDFHPRLHSVLAAGSYLGSVGLYSTNSNRLCSLLEGHTGGLTQLAFSTDGYRLYTGARKDCELLCWDIRQLGRVLSSHTRTVETHQRVAFALASDDATLITGSTDGVVSSWRVGDCSQSAHSALTAAQRFTAHDDCANGVSLHPRLPVLATSSGQRRRPPHPDDASEPPGERDELTIPRQSTVKLWWLGG